VADHFDENTPATDSAVAPAEQPVAAPALPQDAGQPPLPDEPGDAPAADEDLTEAPAVDENPAADETGGGTGADGATAEAVTAPEPAAAPAAAPQPAAERESIHDDPFGSATGARPAVDEPDREPVTDAPRFAAPFSSPEPTAVTARPRRRATRPALSADPDSVAPAPAQAAPTLPAFVSFVAPTETETVAPRRRGRRAQAASPVDAPAAAPAETPGTPAAAPAETPADEDGRDTGTTTPRRGRSRRRAVVEPAAVEEVDQPVAETEERDTEDGEDNDADDRDTDDSGSSSSRRRRRGRRGRGRGRTGDDAIEGDEDGDTAGDEPADEDTGTPAGEAVLEDEDAQDDGEDEDDSDDGDAASGSTTRRRRRRRRRGESSGSSTDDAAEDADDRPERAGRNGRTSSDDDVRGVAGSTRLEAKRQRRREGRDGGRKRAPILSESEFLARREAVDRAMVIRQQGDRTQIAVLEDDVLVEHYVTQAQATSFAGNVYLGRVQNVLPSMEAAFVDIGKGRNAVLYAGEVNWDAAGLSGKSRSIETALKSGDKVLVQVTKDPIGHKGARLTQQVNLPGRFLVYVPGGSMTGISRKLPDKERTRLKDILKKIVPEDAGVIIRTAAEGATEEELTRDVARLQAQWEVIQTKASSTSNAPTLLYGEPDLAIRVIRDVFNEDFKRLVVQGADAWDTVEAYVAHVSPELSERLERYTGTGDVFRDLRIDEQLMKALDRKVWLPSGGSLVIDRTEAMTVVDVNTGKFVGSGGNLEQTVTRNNIEAAEEIVRQLRLRDIGGMIVIDFIDMVLESNRDLVLRRLTECLGRDRTKHQVAEVTSLGLVQMTRKRVGQGLLEVFSEPCEHCRGRGVMVQLDVVDEKRRSGGNGSAGAGPGSGGGGNGRNRDRERAGRDAGDQPRPDTTEQPDAVIAAAEDAGEVPGQSVGETPTEGRSGRRGRGRRGRGQAGEARAAEDAAVLAGTRDDEAADEAVGEPVSPADGEALAEVLHESVGEELAAAAVGAPEEAALSGPADEAVDGAVDEAAGGAHPVAAPAPEAAGTGDVASPAAEPPEVELVTTADEDAAAPSTVDVAVETEPSPAPPVDAGPQPEPAVAPVASTDPVVPVVRPRRRRAASRPAGPPA
jgi:ribonuclease E